MPKKRAQKVTKVTYSESESEYDDEIQTYHKQKDKILLDSDQGDSAESEKEEVYGIDQSDSEDEEIAHMQQQLRQIKRNKIKKKLGSDLEDDTEDEALPDSRAWGSKKSWFMGGDVRDNKIILSGDEDEAGAAALEEKEMREIEKRQTARMSEEDYLPPTLMMMLKKTGEKKNKKLEEKSSEQASDAGEGDHSDETKEKKKSRKKESKKTKSSAEAGPGELERIQVQTDFSKLPKEAEIERMKEMHPEFVPLFNDFKLKMQELQDRIIPLMGLVKRGSIDGLAATYLQMKFHIICNYLICGGFYMYFIAKRAPRIHHHPVMKRLLELQQFYNRLVPVDKRVKADLDKILELRRQGKDVGKVICTVAENGVTSPATSLKKKKKEKNKEEEPAAKKRKIADKQESLFEEEDEDDEEDQLGDIAEDGNEDEQERRAITYEMEKNKGLTAHRKKELKNPRVKHRKKYRRALIRRKGQVRDFKPPKSAYSGEMTGIRAGIIRSRKLK